MLSDDIRWMEQALLQAQRAEEEGEVPVGAVVVLEGRIIGRGYNRIEALQDATAHAEVVAIGAASNALGTWRLNNATLYVTLEPCMMCAGAIRLSRIDRIVYGTADPVAGVLGSTLNVVNEEQCRFSVTPGVLADESKAMLKGFFKRARQRRKKVVPSSPFSE